MLPSDVRLAQFLRFRWTSFGDLMCFNPLDVSLGRYFNTTCSSSSWFSVIYFMPASENKTVNTVYVALKRLLPKCFFNILFSFAIWTLMPVL